MKIGYVGLGALGSELARRFLKDHDLCVWDMNPAARAALQAQGARVATSAAHLASSSDVVLVCLPRTADVRQAVFGPEGLAEGLTPGKLLIDQTSGIPHETAEIARLLAAKRVEVLDAAVSASPQVVPQGGATLMVSGPEEALERARPALSVITQTVLRCGSRVGDAQAMKLVNNAMNAAIRMGTLELTALGRKAGLSLDAISGRLDSGPARNQTTEKMLPALARNQASTNFSLALMVKDVNQAVQLGLTHGVPMPVTAATRGLLQAGLNMRGDAARLEDMVGVIEFMAGTRMAGSETGDSADGEQMVLLETTLAALCHAVTLECIATGFKYGLQLTAMRDVLTRTSGWSAAGRTLLDTLASHGDEQPVPLGACLARLAETTEFAARTGAPVLLLGPVRTLYESAASCVSPEVIGVDPVRAMCEQVSGIRFHTR